MTIMGLGSTGQLIIVIAMVSLALGGMTLMRGNIMEIIYGACEKNPTLPHCDYEDIKVKSFQNAEYSVEALVCAVNTVLTGSEWAGFSSDGKDVKCSDYYVETADAAGEIPPDGSGWNKVTQYIKKHDDCNSKCIADQEELCEEFKTACRVTGGRYVERDTRIIDLKSDKCECDIYIPDRPLVNCQPGEDDDGMECQVYNFQLPQEIDSLEKWINYYGDPQYLVYWQKFPLTEDTWTLDEDARLGYTIAIIGFSVLPFGKMARLFGKAGYSAASKAAVNGASRLKSFFTKTKASGFVSTSTAKAEIRYITKEAAEEVQKAVAKDMVEKFTVNGIFKEGGKRLLKPSTYIKGGIGIGTLTVVDIVDSWLGKLSGEYPNRMLLKYAGEKYPEPYPLEEELSSPVFLKYRGGALSSDTVTLMLASPCYINEMTVRAADGALCEQFIWESTDKGDVINCIGASEGGEKYPSCYEPDKYLKKGGGNKLKEDAEDPVIGYVYSFREEIPKYVEIGNGSATVVISGIGTDGAEGEFTGGVAFKFNARDGRHFDDAYLIFDTEKGIEKIPVRPITAEEAKSDNYHSRGEDHKGQLGAADYKSARIEFFLYDSGDERNAPGCGVTDEGIENLAKFNPSFFSQDKKPSFSELDGVGCLGSFAVVEKCDKNESDDMCDLIKDLKFRREADLNPGTFYRNGLFRYGDNWTISCVLSEPDETIFLDVEYWVELSDMNGDSFIDKIGINSGGGLTGGRRQFIEFYDQNDNFRTFNMKNCHLPKAVIVEDVVKRDDIVGEENYCYASLTSGKRTLRIVGMTLSAVAITVTGIVSFGGSFAVLGVSAGTIATGATVAGAAVDAIAVPDTKWPRSGK